MFFIFVRSRKKMIYKIKKEQFLGDGPIKILYPGLALPNLTDTGIGSIGRIDHPEFHGNTVIKMHPHVNDEIVSYFRSGISEHKDSAGYTENISKNKLMFMKAGKSFYHEEKILGEDEPLEGLQIFIRPGEKDLEPEVLFRDLEHVHSENQWRLLGAPNGGTEFRFSSQTWLYDTKLLEGNSIALPQLENEGLTLLLYVFQGKITLNDAVSLIKKEAAIIIEELSVIYAETDAELILFVTDENSEIFKEGMYSGNKYSSIKQRL